MSIPTTADHTTTTRSDVGFVARKNKRLIFVASLAMVMVFGLTIYFRLGAVDHYTISRDEIELLRMQFDRVSREAMEESAEWRRKYDEEVERSCTCIKE